MTQDTSSSQDLLNDAIREASGEAVRGQPSAGGPAESHRAVSIEEALQDHHAAPANKAVQRTSGATHSALRRPVDSSINAVLAKVGAGGTAPTPSPAQTNAKNTAETLAEAVSGLGADMPESATRSGTGQRWMGLIVALALLLAAVGYGWLQQRLTDSATVLRDLASAVEQHRSKHNGVLPESLARMEAFPKGAVEWPLRYWNARDASGRTEIIWVRQKAHYRIMLRQGNETWTLTDGEPTPKLMMTGKP